MKKYLTQLILVFTVVLGETACTKDPVPATPNPERTIKFNLYTEEDFSDDDHKITFSLFIRNHTKTLFDSTVAVMKVKDIPNFSSKLMFEKKVPDNDTSELAAGFYYVIENVGMSWYLDTCKAGQTSKQVNFSFK